MKKWILDLVFCLIPVLGFSQDVTGKWKAPDNKSVMEIYVENGICKGKVIWITPELDKPDAPLLDLGNKNKALRSRPLNGLVIIDGMKKNGNEWKGGKVYDPETGRSYDCTLKVVDGKLHIRGSLGPIGKTLKWTRSDIKTD